MSRHLAFFVLALSLLLAGFFYLALTAHYTGYNVQQGEQNSVCFSQDCFQVEIASTPQEQERGLMYRDTLPLDRGMLFVFAGPGKPAFWMKNTKIPLDILWLDSQGRVVYVHENSLPCTTADCPVITSPADARFVLEINSGLAKAKHISEGSQAKFILS